MSDTAVEELGGVAVTRRSRDRLFVRVRSHHGPLELLLALAIYVGFACYFTWPLVTDLSHTFYGAGGDPLGTMSFFRELVAHHYNPFLPGTITQLNAPEGQPIPWTRDLAAMPGVLSLYLLSAGFGSTAGYGLYALLGYTLTGSAMFLFVRRLTRNAWAAIIAGWAFAFYPYAIVNGQGHDDNIQGWVLVLGTWRMVELMKRPTRRNALLAGFAVVFGMWWTPYFILLGGVAYAAAAVGSLAVGWRTGRLRQMLGPQAITAVIVVVFLGFLLLLTTGPQGNSAGLRINPVQAFDTYAARPLEYILPDAQSPLFGGDTSHYLVTHIHGSNVAEATLYVGVTTILLALIAFWAFLRRKLPAELGGTVFILALIAVVALLTSAPPEARVFGVLVPFPSHFIAKVTSTWRVYARFVIVVMLALSALAGIGLHAVTRGRAWWAALAIMLGASVLVPLDLWGRLAGRTNKIEVPSLYKELGRQPAGLVASYPLTPVGENAYGELFFRNVINKPLINGYLENTPEEKRALSLADISDPSTPGRLAALGVRYVIAESAPPGYGQKPLGRPARGLRLLYKEPYGSVYVVTAPPSAPALAATGSAFGVNEPMPTGIFNWLLQPRGTIELAGACDRHCRGVLRMTLFSFAQPRTVTISTASGTVLARLRVSQPTTVAVPLTFKSPTSIRIAASPGPQSVHKTTGSTDLRSVSVQVGNLQFTAAAGERPAGKS